MTRNELLTWSQPKNRARMLLVRTLVLATGLSLAAPSAWAQGLQRGIAHRVQALEDRMIALEHENAELRGQLAELAPLAGLADLVFVDRDPVNGLNGPHVVFEGVNVHIRSGEGSTDEGFGGMPEGSEFDNLSGLGNLVIGYNEEPAPTTTLRGGSHNLVLGAAHSFSSYGGLVAGLENTLMGGSASVSGGFGNKAERLAASVSGGSQNIARARAASISGGLGNLAAAFGASVSGGSGNTAGGLAASVSGGQNVTASDASGWNTGGDFNELAALSDLSDFVYVEMNTLNGLVGPHVIFEGANVHVRSGAGSTDEGFEGSDPGSEVGNLSALGNLLIGYNEEGPPFQTPRGGAHNLIIGPRHVYRSYGGFLAGTTNEVSGRHGSVGSGQENSVSSSGFAASVTGGLANSARGATSSISGGVENLASGEVSSVGGGFRNTASGLSAHVSGGIDNEAKGVAASVNGGNGVEISGECDWGGENEVFGDASCL